MFENGTRFRPMGLSDPWVDHKNKQLSTNMEMLNKSYNTTQQN